MKAKEKSGNSGRTGGGIFFFAGFILMMVAGWVVFPRLLYSEKTQPVQFRHDIAEGHSECEDCHRFRDDGTYSGIPSLDACRQCHEQPIGDSETEKLLVQEYIEKDKEIPWLAYSWQPDNVYFSHAAHIKRNLPCTRCHRDVNKEGKAPPYWENRLTGYSKNTMRMVECEKCHAEQHASNACQVCHK